MTTPGLDEIAARFREDGAGAAVSGGLEIVLGRVAAGLDRQQQKEQRLQQLVNVVPIKGAVPLTAGAGVLDYPDRYGPTDGFTWDVRRVSADGWSAGSVAMYVDDPNGVTVRVAAWTTPGSWTWSGQLWLRARDRLVWIATGITGTVQLDGNAHLVSESMVPEYIL